MAPLARNTAQTKVEGLEDKKGTMFKKNRIHTRSPADVGLKKCLKLL